MLVKFNLWLSKENKEIQSAKVIFLYSKCKIIFVTQSNYYFFQYCFRNIGLPSIASCKVIDALNLRSLFTFFNCFFSVLLSLNFRFSNYFGSNSCRSFTLLKAIAKTKLKNFTIAYKKDNYRASNKEKKQRTNTKYKKGYKSHKITFNKSPILLSQY